MIQIEKIPAWLRENGRFILHKDKEPLNRYGRRTEEAAGSIRPSDRSTVYHGAASGRHAFG